MDENEWLDNQEDFEQKRKLNEAIREASEAGVDVAKVIKDSVAGYKEFMRLAKTKEDKKHLNISVKRVLLDGGITSEFDAVFVALSNATKKARSQTP